MKTTRTVLPTAPSVDKELVSTTEAMRLAKEKGLELSRPTFVAMCEQNGLSTQVVREGWWRVNKKKLLQFLESRRVG